MTEVFNRQDFSDLPPQDKMGFAVPKTPAHSFMLLNSYMRTDLLRHIHLRLHQMRDTNEPGAPLHQLAKRHCHVCWLAPSTSRTLQHERQRD
jgi:hypothetical protein